MAVSKRLRYEILRRDNNTCRYCGQSAPDVKLTVDHVVPTALGGSDDPSNLVAACKDCNAGKSASSPDAALVAAADEKAMRWSQAMTRVVEERAAELAAERARTDPFDTAWSAWTVNGQPVPRDPNWKNSILRFLGGGLDDEFMVDAIHTAMGLDRVPASEKWRYFCGICWREMDDLRERAAALLEDDGSAAATPPTREPEFEYMAMFEDFLDHLVPELGGDEQVRKFAIWTLWDAMPEAHQEWRARLQNPGTLDPELTAEDVALDAAREQLSNEIANAMYEIRVWRESRDRSLRTTGGDSDGA